MTTITRSRAIAGTPTSVEHVVPWLPPLRDRLIRPATEKIHPYWRTWKGRKSRLSLWVLCFNCPDFNRVSRAPSEYNGAQLYER
jgi:hypothetical protein